MRLIRSIRVQGFRSIRDQVVDPIGGMTSLVGRNSSGKSNLLRAMNLFFNGYLQAPGDLSFPRDHHTRPQSNRKKRISVTVEFDVPGFFKYRKGLDQLKALGSRFSITRAWELDERRVPFGEFSVDADRVIPNEENVARQFLGLISYRYVPNRTIPAHLLRDESQAIADSILMRMKGGKHAEELLNNLTSSARKMLADAGESLKLAGSPLLGPSITTAESIGEMLTMSGFQASGKHGQTVRDEDWGSGHQAFFLYLVLHLLDTNYGRFWGWKQGTVWGVEEPESGLHRDLETRLADTFRTWSEDQKSRLQILQSTHSPTFTMASDQGYWVDLVGAETTFEPQVIPRLTRSAEKRGVSAWTHPVLSFPWNPVILVEGGIDVDVLSHVAALSGYDHYCFLTVPELDAQESTRGKDALRVYVGKTSGLIQNRPPENPLVVLFDWEASDQDLIRTRKSYGLYGEDRVLRMNTVYCDPLLGKDFGGIERFYPPDVLADAHAAGEIAIAMPKGNPYSVSKAQLESAKGALRDRVLKVTDPAKFSSLIKVLNDVEAGIRAGKDPQGSLPGM